MFFQECTPRFPAKKKIRTPLTQTHRVVFVITGPLEQGYPVRRRRLHSAGIANHSFIWVGPEADAAIQEDFDSIFNAACVSSGEVFFGEHVNTQSLTEFRETLPAGYRYHFDTADAMRATRAGVNGEYLCDLEHYPGSFNSMPSPIWPSMLTHGSIFSWRHRRVASGADHCAPLMLSNRLAPALRDLSDANLKALSGNGMACPVVAAWFLYV